MEKRDRLNVYFEMDGRPYLLFHVVNIGTKDTPDFKFSGFSDYVIVNDEPTSLSKDGVMSEDDFAKSFFSKRSELTYHKDGSMLKKTPDNPSGKIYTNPHGRDVRWTPPSEVKSIQPVFYICIRRIDTYTPSSLESKDKVVNYVCKNEDLFNEQGTYFVLFFLKKKNINIAQYTTPDSYCDIIFSGCKDIDLCIIIARHSYPKPQPRQSKYFGHAIITPYAMNSYNFCKKYDTFDSLLGKEVAESVKKINQYMLTLVGSEFCRIKKEEVQIIELSEKLYDIVFQRYDVSKALLVRAVLLAYEYVVYKSNSIQDRKDSISTFFSLFRKIPLHKEAILKILESKKSEDQKVKDIRMVVFRDGVDN